MNCSVFLLLAGSLAFFAIARGKNLTCYCNQPTKDCIGVNGNSIWGDGQCSMPVGEGVCLAIWGRDPRVIHVYTCSIYLIGQDLSVCHPSGPQLIGLSFITACCQTSYCNTPDYLRSVVNEIDSDITQLLSSTNASGSSNKTQLQSPTNASGRKNLTCYCNQPTGDCIRVIGNSIWGQCSMPVGEGVCLATWGRNPQVAVHTCSSNLIGRDLSVCHPSKPQLIGLSNITACCQTSYCNTPDYLKSVVNELDSNKTQLQSPTNASGKSNNTQLQSPTNASGSSNKTQLQSPTNASGTSCIIAIIVMVAVLFCVVYKRLSKPPPPASW